MVVQTSCLCSFLCVKWQRFKAFVSMGVHCLRHELGPFAHILTRSHSLTFSGARSPTLPHHTSTSSGNTWASAVVVIWNAHCRGLGRTQHRELTFQKPVTGEEESGDRRSCSGTLPLLAFSELLTCLICCWCHTEKTTLLLSVIVIHCFKSLHSESHSILLWCASPCPQLISTWWPSLLPVFTVERGRHSDAGCLTWLAFNSLWDSVNSDYVGRMLTYKKKI